MKLEYCTRNAAVMHESVVAPTAEPLRKIQNLPVGLLPAAVISCAALASTTGLFSLPANAQGFTQPNLAPITLSQNVRPDPVPNPTVIPTDVTPIPIGQERELIRPGYRFYLMQKLPRKMWFNATVETSQRLETNVFFTNNNPRPDYVFRVLPNISLGYNFLPHTSFYWNYFVIKDVFADNGILSYPTTQSLAGGLRHEIPVNNRTNIQLDVQARELWQAAGLRQSDIIPSITATRVFTPRCIGFANIQMQMRGAYPFNGPSREIDPFYTLGVLYRWKQWTFSATDTFVTNYRGSNAIPPQGNVAMIADFEVNRPIHKKLPGVVAFVRAEPIWNWSSHAFPGLSGFDFRLFSGIRMSVSKPSYSADFNKLREQIQGNDSGYPTKTNKQTAPSTPSGSGSGTPGSGNGSGSGNQNDPNTGSDTPPGTLLPLPPSSQKPEADGSANGGISNATDSGPSFDSQTTSTSGSEISPSEVTSVSLKPPISQSEPSPTGLNPADLTPAVKSKEL